MKKTYKLRLLGVLFFIFLLSAGQPIVAEKPNLIDDYGVFSDEEAVEVGAKLAEFSAEKQIDYLIIFSEPFSNPKESVYTDYIENFYYKNGYGWGKDRTGAVMLVDMANRKISVRGLGSAMYPVFASDANIDTVAEKVGEELRDEDYTGAVDVFMSESYRLYRRYNRTFMESVFDMMFSLRGLAAALIGGGLVMLIVWGDHNQNGKPKPSEFEVGGSFRLQQKTDTFSHKNVTSRKIERSRGSGGGGSHASGSTSRSSGGTRSF